MSYIWTRKIQNQLHPGVQPQVYETIQEVDLPVYSPNQDKISHIEHKNGKCLVSSCKENDAFGSREEEIHGEEVVLSCIKDCEVNIPRTQGKEDNSSSFSSLKN